MGLVKALGDEIQIFFEERITMNVEILISNKRYVKYLNLKKVKANIWAKNKKVFLAFLPSQETDIPPTSIHNQNWLQ